MDLNHLESIIDEATNKVKENLTLSSIDIKFIVKIKDINKTNCIAIYRGGTIRRGDKAIVWISPEFPQVLSEKIEISISDPDFKHQLLRNLEDTISHELIHALQDFLGLLTQTGANFDEEEAENLGLALSRGESIENSNLVQNITAHLKNKKEA